MGVRDNKFLYIILLMIIISIVYIGVDNRTRNKLSLDTLRVHIDGRAIKTMNITDHTFTSIIFNIPYYGYVQGNITAKGHSLMIVDFNALKDKLEVYNKSLYRDFSASVMLYLGYNASSPAEARELAVDRLDASYPIPSLTLIFINYHEDYLSVQEITIPMDQFLNFSHRYKKKAVEKPGIVLGGAGALSKALRRTMITLYIDESSLKLLKRAGEYESYRVSYNELEVMASAIFNTSILPDKPVNPLTLPRYKPSFLEGSYHLNMDIHYSESRALLKLAEKLRPIINESIVRSNGNPASVEARNLTFNKLKELYAYTYYVRGGWDEAQGFLHDYMKLLVRGESYQQYGLTPTIPMHLLIEGYNDPGGYTWKPVGKHLEEYLGVSRFAVNNVSLIEYRLDNHAPTTLANGRVIYPLVVEVGINRFSDSYSLSSPSLGIGPYGDLSTYFHIDESFISRRLVKSTTLYPGFEGLRAGIYANAIVSFGESEDLGFIIFIIRHYNIDNSSYYAVKPLFSIIPPVTVYWSTIHEGVRRTRAIIPANTLQGTSWYRFYNYTYPLDYNESWPPPETLPEIPLCLYRLCITCNMKGPDDTDLSRALPSNLQVPIAAILSRKGVEAVEALALEVLDYTGISLRRLPFTVTVELYLDPLRLQRYYDNGYFQVYGDILLSNPTARVLQALGGVRDPAFRCGGKRVRVVGGISLEAVSLMPSNVIKITTYYNGTVSGALPPSGGHGAGNASQQPSFSLECFRLYKAYLCVGIVAPKGSSG